jgi:hypothetical protein
MTLMNIVTAGAITIGAGLVPLYASGTQERVTVTGCAVSADGDGDGFLLANAVGQGKRMLYWLDDDDDEVKKLMGQFVEVTGDIKGEVKRAEIEIERENGMIEFDIKSGGRKATVKLPEGSSAVGASVKAREVELEYDVRKLEVKSAKSIAPSCK